MRYDSPNTPFDNLRSFVYRGGSPVTTALLIINAITFFMAFTSRQASGFFSLFLAFDPLAFLHAPWTLLTYPFIYLDVTDHGFFNFLFGGFFFWSTGGSLERSWGSPLYARLFAALTVISGVFLWLGSFILHQDFLLYSFFLPVAGLIVAFCMLRPEETLSYFFFPVKAKYVAIITTAFTWVVIGRGGQPLLGLFGCGGILVAYLYAVYGRSGAGNSSYGAPRRAAPRGPDLRVYPAARSSSPTMLDGSRKRGPFDLAGRWKDWQERRRLEKLLRNSGFSDSEPRWRDDEERRRR